MPGCAARKRGASWAAASCTELAVRKAGQRVDGHRLREPECLGREFRRFGREACVPEPRQVGLASAAQRVHAQPHWRFRIAGGRDRLHSPGQSCANASSIHSGCAWRRHDPVRRGDDGVALAQAATQDRVDEPRGARAPERARRFDGFRDRGCSAWRHARAGRARPASARGLQDPAPHPGGRAALRDRRRARRTSAGRRRRATASRARHAGLGRRGQSVLEAAAARRDRGDGSRRRGTDRGAAGRAQTRTLRVSARALAVSGRRRHAGPAAAPAAASALPRRS